MAKRQRKEKHCIECNIASAILYRIHATELNNWGFYCKQCQVKRKQLDPNYRYGGVWKQIKRH